MTGSVLASYSATYVHKLINIVELQNYGAPKVAQTRQRPFHAQSVNSRPHLRRMPVDWEWKDQVESLRAAWIADFRVWRDETAADLTGGTTKA
jgi:hypothetical protein